VEWMSGRENRSTGRKSARVPLCPPQISHDLTRARIRAAAVRSRRLTAWTTTGPGTPQGDKSRVGKRQQQEATGTAPRSFKIYFFPLRSILRSSNGPTVQIWFRIAIKRTGRVVSRVVLYTRGLWIESTLRYILKRVRFWPSSSVAPE
jgi:hypothetical protein